MQAPDVGRHTLNLERALHLARKVGKAGAKQLKIHGLDTLSSSEWRGFGNNLFQFIHERQIFRAQLVNLKTKSLELGALHIAHIFQSLFVLALRSTQARRIRWGLVFF